MCLFRSPCLGFPPVAKEERLPSPSTFSQVTGYMLLGIHSEIFKTATGEEQLFAKNEF